jgi:hypothetical protein
LAELTTLHSSMLQKMPVMINGDDILFAVRSDHDYELWSETITQFGFCKSVGKNYVCHDALMINSQLYHVTRGHPFALTSHYLPYYNTGLLTGQSKVCGRLEGRTRPVASILNEVLEGAAIPATAFRRYVFYNRDSVKQATTNGLFNLFLDRHVGGLGVDSRGIEYKVTRFQSHLGTQILSVLAGGVPWSLAHRLLGTEEKTVGFSASHPLVYGLRPSHVLYAVVPCQPVADRERDEEFKTHILSYHYGFVERVPRTLSALQCLKAFMRDAGLQSLVPKIKRSLPLHLLQSSYTMMPLRQWGHMPNFPKPRQLPYEVLSCYLANVSSDGNGMPNDCTGGPR